MISRPTLSRKGRQAGALSGGSGEGNDYYRSHCEGVVQAQRIFGGLCGGSATGGGRYGCIPFAARENVRLDGLVRSLLPCLRVR